MVSLRKSFGFDAPHGEARIDLAGVHTGTVRLSVCRVKPRFSIKNAWQWDELRHRSGVRLCEAARGFRRGPDRKYEKRSRSGIRQAHAAGGAVLFFVDCGCGMMERSSGRFLRGRNVEVVDGCDRSPHHGYDLPRSHRLARTWVWMRARASWVI